MAKPQYSIIVTLHKRISFEDAEALATLISHLPESEVVVVQPIYDNDTTENNEEDDDNGKDA